MPTDYDIKKILDRNNIRPILEAGENCCIVKTPERLFPQEVPETTTRFIFENDGLTVQSLRETELIQEKKIECPAYTRKIFTLLSFINICTIFQFPFQYAKFIIKDEEVDKDTFYNRCCWDATAQEKLILRAAEGKCSQVELENGNILEGYNFLQSVVSSKSQS